MNHVLQTISMIENLLDVSLLVHKEKKLECIFAEIATSASLFRIYNHLHCENKNMPSLETSGNIIPA